MLGTACVRVLEDRDLPEALALAGRDPVINLVVASRLESAGMRAGRLGAELWGYEVDGRLESLCYLGANLVPVAASEDAVGAFAQRAKRRGRRCSSIVGPAEAVTALWERLEPSWGPARSVRSTQPLLATSAPSADVRPDPLVRRVLPEELPILLPACVAMFTEEVGISPNAGDGGALYTARIRELVATGRAFARIEDGQVIFKAEIGAVSPEACQVQGVWVPPERRGEGLSVTGMAAVVEHALRDIAPVVSLYVNGYNVPARRSYTRVGFREVGTFMSVLF